MTKRFKLSVNGSSSQKGKLKSFFPSVPAKFGQPFFFWQGKKKKTLLALLVGLAFFSLSDFSHHYSGGRKTVWVGFGDLSFVERETRKKRSQKKKVQSWMVVVLLTFLQVRRRSRSVLAANWKVLRPHLPPTPTSNAIQTSILEIFISRVIVVERRRRREECCRRRRIKIFIPPPFRWRPPLLDGSTVYANGSVRGDGWSRSAAVAVMATRRPWGRRTVGEKALRWRMWPWGVARGFIPRMRTGRGICFLEAEWRYLQQVRGIFRLCLVYFAFGVCLYGRLIDWLIVRNGQSIDWLIDWLIAMDFCNHFICGFTK